MSDLVQRKDLDPAAVEAAAYALVGMKNERCAEAERAGIVDPSHIGYRIDLNEDEYTRDEFMEDARVAVSAYLDAVATEVAEP
jgi:hypothetical protein